MKKEDNHTSVANLELELHKGIEIVLDTLVQESKHTDFKKTELGKLKEGKLTNRDKSVIIIEQIIRTASRLNWNVCSENGFVSIFNRIHWSEVSGEAFTNFLGEVAAKMGMQILEAKHHYFKAELFKQFLSSAYFPAPNVDNNITKVNLLNGTLFITAEKIELKKHNPKDFLKYVLNFEYNPTADCPKFKKFLDEVLPDKSKQLVLAEYIASIFIKNGVLKLEKILLLYGGGSNGKSVLFEILNALLGEVNISNYSLENLTDQSGYYRAMIGRKLLNYASEISPKNNVTMVKQLASGEPMDAREPYGKPFIIKDYAKLIFNTNTLPERVEQTDAFYRRFLIIHFDQTIPEEKQDRQLAQKIIDTELSGVLNWVLEGLQRLLKQKGFSHSVAVERALKVYKHESNPVAMWLTDNNWKKSDSYVPLQDIYTYYRDYCIKNGFWYENRTKFKKHLETLGITIKRMNIGVVAFIEKETN